LVLGHEIGARGAILAQHALETGTVGKGRAEEEQRKKKEKKKDGRKGRL